MTTLIACLWLEGATKLHFTHSCVVIIFFIAGLSESAFSTCYFGKIVFRLSVFDMFSVCSEF